MNVELDYVACCKVCGRIIGCAAAALESVDPKHLAKDVARWIRGGFSVQRLTAEGVKKCAFGHTDDCANKPKKR